MTCRVEEEPLAVTVLMKCMPEFIWHPACAVAGVENASRYIARCRHWCCCKCPTCCRTDRPGTARRCRCRRRCCHRRLLRHRNPRSCTPRRLSGSQPQRARPTAASARTSAARLQWCSSAQHRQSGKGGIVSSIRAAATQRRIAVGCDTGTGHFRLRAKRIAALAVLPIHREAHQPATHGLLSPDDLSAAKAEAQTSARNRTEVKK